MLRTAALVGGLLGAVVSTTSLFAQDFPASPMAPTESDDCKALSREYYDIIRDLERQHEALGLGWGPHVHAGQCCAKSAPGNRSWCMTYQSHAVLWEKIHCATLAKDAAVSQCLAKVSAIRAVREAAEEELRDDDLDVQRALDLIKIKDWMELADTWRNTGNDPASLQATVDQTSRKIVDEAISNPVIRQVINDNLDRLNIANSDVQTEFDNAIASLETEYPNAGSNWSDEEAGPAPAGRVSSVADCQRDVKEKIASCANSIMSDPSHDPSDFSFWATCKQKFGSQYAACGP